MDIWILYFFWMIWRQIFQAFLNVSLIDVCTHWSCVYTLKYNYYVIGEIYVYSSNDSAEVFSKMLDKFTPPPAMCPSSNLYILSLILSVLVFSPFHGCVVIYSCTFICISLITNELWPFGIFYFVKCSLKMFSIFKNRTVCPFLLLACQSFYIFWI